MSSHREAPGTSKDPVADNTDVYAFVSPDQPSMVTLIANFIPFELPFAGPYFYEFGQGVLYEIHIDNDGDGDDDITYQFQFVTAVRNPDEVFYNTGPINSLDDPNWNVRQFYSVRRVNEDGSESVMAENLAVPPANIGPHSTPNYAALAQAAVHMLPSGEVVFAGPRAEGFYIDVGAAFDLLDLRPFQNLHLMPMPAAPGVNGLNTLNIHSIAIQIPKTMLTQGGYNPTDPTDPRSTIGVYASAKRQRVIIRDGDGSDEGVGPYIQVSRLANPLFNELLNPIGEKDLWNALPPPSDSRFVQNVQHPEVSALLPVLYPGVFPNLAALNASNTARTDLVAILLTGLPAGVIPGFQNYTGPTLADLQRLNMAIPPSPNPNILGLLGGDLAGFPNGRRVIDDVVTIELRALAGVTYALIDPSYTPDAAATQVTDGVDPSSIDSPFLSSFPYLGLPYSGFSYMPGSATP